MDKERYEEEKNFFKKFKEPQKGDSKYYNYRLITEEEVPEWIKASVINQFFNLYEILDNLILSLNLKKTYKSMAEETEFESK